MATRARARGTFPVPGLQSFVWSSRHHRKTLAAYELFPVPLRTGGQGAADLVSHRRSPSGTGALGPRRQRFHPIIQLAKRMARGFKNFVYFRTVAYHRAGQLNLDVPNMS